MKNTLLATTMAISLGLGCSAFAQTSAPVGGPDAKGNAPLKHAHTVNDGSAKPGANSFTEGQARQHIMKSGYSDVSGLTKGKDGVWRGMATHNGASVSVAMDFKGNVTEAVAAETGGSAGAGAGATASDAGSQSTTQSATTTNSASTSGASTVHHHHHRHHHHRHHGRCANPTPNGAACSGVDTNGKGISDKEQNAIQAGAHP